MAGQHACEAAGVTDDNCAADSRSFEGHARGGKNQIVVAENSLKVGYYPAGSRPELVEQEPGLFAGGTH